MTSGGTTHSTAAAEWPWLDYVPAENTTCIWSTNGLLELMSLPERDWGRWEEVRPKPIVLPGWSRPSRPRPSLSRRSSGTTPQKTNEPPSSSSLNADRQLLFTFRIDLPAVSEDLPLPPTLVATSCRYYYTLIIRMVTIKSIKRKQPPTWIQIPIRVLTAAPLYSKLHTSYPIRNPVLSLPIPMNNPAAVIIGTPTRTTAMTTTKTNAAVLLHAMAHSQGLPGRITATELNAWDGRLTAHYRHSAAHSQHMCPRPLLTSSDAAPAAPPAVQTMKVTDPVSGRRVALLTVLGGSQLYPGSRIVLQLDFPHKSKQQHTTGSSDDAKDDNDHHNNWVPLYQASACLEGEETVIRVRDGHRARARLHLFDTAHVPNLDPACIESVSLPLLLPLDAPVSVATAQVEIFIRIVMDLVVGTTTTTANTSTTDGGTSTTSASAATAAKTFRNLRLEIPCSVVHAPFAWELDQDDDRDPEEEEEEPEETTQPGAHARFFPTSDIHKELKILSLCLADRCHLRPTTTQAECMGLATTNPYPVGSETTSLSTPCHELV